jgi:transcriptional regulator with XRE-family HTH domain
MKRNKDVVAFKIAEDLNAEIRKLFTARMKTLGMTQEEVSRRMGKSRSNVAVLLTQNNIMSLPVIIDFCRALDLDMKMLFNERQPSVSTEVG